MACKLPGINEERLYTSTTAISNQIHTIKKQAFYENTTGRSNGDQIGALEGVQILTSSGKHDGSRVMAQ